MQPVCPHCKSEKGFKIADATTIDKRGYFRLVCCSNCNFVVGLLDERLADLTRTVEELKNRLNR